MINQNHDNEQENAKRQDKLLEDIETRLDKVKDIAQYALVHHLSKEKMNNLNM